LLIDDKINARHARRQGWRKGGSTPHAEVVVDEAEPASNAGTLRPGRLHLLKMAKIVATPTANQSEAAVMDSPRLTTTDFEGTDKVEKKGPLLKT
jgi:hypothetical protein